MKYLLVLFLFMCSCATPPKQHTYLKYAGYVEGCIEAVIYTAVVMNPRIKSPQQINVSSIQAICMEMYMNKLNKEGIKPEGLDNYLDRNEAI